MLAKRIIPCLDVTSGRVVKGVNFVGLRDAGDPVEIARRYDEQGADELCFLDITASSDDRGIILHIIESVASRWHYLIDLPAGALLAVFVVWLTNRLCDRTERCLRSATVNALPATCRPMRRGPKTTATSRPGAGSRGGRTRCCSRRCARR